MKTSSWPFMLDPVHPWAYWEQTFTERECKEIIKIGNKQAKEQGKVSNSNILNGSVRKSEISWLHPNEETAWVFKRMTDVVLDLNARFFQFDLFGAMEGFQFTKYSAPGGKYGKHTDSSLNFFVRKLSFTLQLSNPKDYEGGDLCLYFGDKPEVISRQQGYVVVFPSYTLHEVTPVTKGTRYSLVSWITGKPFK